MFCSLVLIKTKVFFFLIYLALDWSGRYQGLHSKEWLKTSSTAIQANRCQCKRIWIGAHNQNKTCSSYCQYTRRVAPSLGKNVELAACLSSGEHVCQALKSSIRGCKALMPQIEQIAAWRRRQSKFANCCQSDALAGRLTPHWPDSQKIERFFASPASPSAFRVRLGLVHFAGRTSQRVLDEGRRAHGMDSRSAASSVLRAIFATSALKNADYRWQEHSIFILYM